MYRAERRACDCSQFVYVREAFSPSLDEKIATLYQVFHWRHCHHSSHYAHRSMQYRLLSALNSGRRTLWTVSSL
jgi:hypothetical protein